MRTFRACFLVALLIFPLSAQRRERKVVRIRDVGRPVATSALLKGHHAALAGYTPATKAAEVTYGQAPGIVQFNLFDSSRITWFVTTEKIPAGSIITPFLIFPGQVEYELKPWELTEDLDPGISLILPSFSFLGDFFPSGLLTYDVIVDSGGQVTHAAADYVVNAFRNAEDTRQMMPRISWSAQLGTIEKPELVIQGNFTKDTPKLLLEDIVVPADAVKDVMPWHIVVDLTKIPGFDTGVLCEYLLSVAQNGWCDTSITRYVPYQ